MANYIDQRHTTKTCKCGRGKIITGHGSKHNSKVDGKQVCVECAMDAIYEKIKK